MLSVPFALGALLALAAATGWAAQYVLIRVGTEHGRVSDAVLVALGVNVAVLVPAAAVVHYPEYGLTPRALVAFGGAGIAGSLFGRLFQFRSIDAIGATRTAPVVSSTALVSAVFAVALLGETLSPLHLVGIVLIVIGVAVISWETASDADPDASFREIGLALVLPLLAALAYGIEPILVRWGFVEGTPVLVAVAVMSVAAAIGYSVHLLRRGAWPSRSELRTEPFRWYLWAGVASTVSLTLYFAALEIAPVVIVVPIIQVAPLLVAAFSFAFLPRRLERVTPRLVAAAAIVVVGATIVSLSG